MDERIKGALATFSEVHPYRGVVIPGKPPTVLIRATPDLAPLGDPRLSLFPCVWDDTVLGTSLVLTMIDVEGDMALCWLGRDHPALEDLEEGVFQVLFVKHRHPVRAVNLDYGASPDVALVWKDTLHAVSGDSAAIIDDADAHFWEVLDGVNVPRSQHDQLQLGWVRGYRWAVQQLADCLSRIAEGALPVIREDSLPVDIAKLLSFGRTGSRATQQAIELVAKRILSGTFPSFLNDYLTHVLDDTPSAELRELISRSQFAATLSSGITQCGRRVLGDCRPESPRVPMMEIDLRRIPVAPEEFWGRLASSPMVFAPWGDVLTTDDAPITAEAAALGWDFVRTTASVEDLDAAADGLMAEAISSKRWTIPPRALVELHVGAFDYIEFFEQSDVVHFVFRAQAGVLWGKVQTRLVGKDIPNFSAWNLPVPPSVARRSEVVAALRLLLSGVIRDFWVVESRNRVFGTASRTLGPRVASGLRAETRIVYLPRIRYDRAPAIARCSSELGLTDRRAHWVMAHLRRSSSMSPAAELLASAYGVRIPDGFTFVRPHERGHLKRNIIYRSRSALHCLYRELGGSNDAGGAQWFKFETDIRAALELQGFDVQHVAASRTGDRGIDLIAQKGEGLNEIAWVIQAKCWKKSVGPAVIREMIGAVRGHARGTRAMVMTTSTFTDAARVAADEGGVQLMDGDDLRGLLQVGR